MQLDRGSGILLHVTSLPSRYGIGDLGPEAYAFLDFLHASGQRVWQVLPLVPVDAGGSPYSSPSTFAGNPLFVSPDLLVDEALLDADVLDRLLADMPPAGNGRIDYRASLLLKDRVIGLALETYRRGRGKRLASEYETFRERHESWIDDFALFMAIKEAHGHRGWTEWPTELARRTPEVLDAARRDLAARVEHHRFAQFLFERQWQRLKHHANDLGVRILGDLPIYVAHDSADVWAHPELFELDQRGNPRVVAGVPPDYFSETGQRWGNPIYRWPLMAEQGFHWWLQRFERCFQHVDFLRIDHFRGLQAYWEIPADEPTAVNGRWVSGPGASLFEALEKRLGRLPIVAEDLGLITPDVTALMNELGLPGMAVLHFAFGNGATSSYLPHNFHPNLVAYTGTHDNDTTVGWWRLRAKAPRDSHEGREYAFARRYLSIDDEQEVHWAFIHLLMASVARLVVFPLQDVLGLGSEARMNVPGKNEGNWQWHLSERPWSDPIARRLRSMSETYGRLEAD